MKILYSIKLDDGTLAESNLEEEAMELELQDSPFPEQINQLLAMLDPGMETEHVLTPANGWGDRLDENIHMLLKAEFSQLKGLDKGMILEFNLPNGETIPGAIIAIEEEQIKVDFNHPYAGQVLHFYLKRVA